MTNTTPEQRLTILANSDVSRGKFAAAAVHAALMHYGIEHGAVIVLGATQKGILEGCDLVVRDAGRTEVRPGTVTAGVRKEPTPEGEVVCEHRFTRPATVDDPRPLCVSCLRIVGA